MSAYSYTKLFSSITESTVWCEPAGTRLVWITLLAKCDLFGRFTGSLPGLARLANVSLDETTKAMETLLAPDPYSRTPEHEGRRLAVIDGGWRLLNHEKYRELRDDERRRLQNREAKRRQREQEDAAGGKGDADAGAVGQDESSPPGHVSKPADSQHLVISTPPMSAHATATATASATFALEGQQHVQPAAAPSRFLEFWGIYPNKKGKQDAERIWLKRKLDHRCDQLLEHVRLMETSDADWLRGCAPMGSTYLNGSRWEDVPKRVANGSPSKHGSFENRAYGAGGDL